MTFSKFQEAIFAFIADLTSTVSAVIEAVAGSGKTTTIAHAVSLISPSKRVLLTSFGKAIVTELQSRINKPNVAIATLNSIGFNVAKQLLGIRFVKITDSKTRFILWDMFPKVDGKQAREVTMYGDFVKRLVGLAKNIGVGALPESPNEHSTWQRLIVLHDLTLQSKAATEEKAIEIAMEVLKRSNEKAKTLMDFDDQLYLPILLGGRFQQYDVILVDEAQDTNRIQQEILKLSLAPGGRLIAVGDTSQGIYGFRGADTEAMNRFRSMFNAIDLPLSVSYRISKAVCRLAQKYVPHITTPDDAPEGKVEQLEEYSLTTFKASDVIVCRNVAPLVKLAWAFISKGIGVKILGRDIGEGLVRLIVQMDAASVDGLLLNLEEYRKREVQKLIDRGRESQAEGINDKCDAIAMLVNTLSENDRGIDSLIKKVESLFSDDKSVAGMLTLSTVHRAKGLEWERVFILDFAKLMPSKYATQEWQLEQENHLIYVAITRAKLELYFIGSEGLVQSDKPCLDSLD